MARLVPFGSLSYALTGQATEPGWWWSTAEEINPMITVVEEVLRAAQLAGIEVSAAIRAAVEGLGWVPLVYEQGAHMDWIRAAIHANLGTNEQLIHSLNLTPSGSSPAALPTDEAGLKAVGAEVITAWREAFAHDFGTVGFTSAAYNLSAKDLAYDSVRVSVLRQTEARAKDGTGGKVTTVVPTASVPFAPALLGGRGGELLPLEVACCVSLTTRQLGPSSRGRIYFGGLTPSSMSVDGKFGAGVQDLGRFFGRFCESMRRDTLWQVAIISNRTLSSHEVTGTKVGTVPDSQRSRRQAQAENRVVTWTAPVA